MSARSFHPCHVVPSLWIPVARKFRLALAYVDLGSCHFQRCRLCRNFGAYCLSKNEFVTGIHKPFAACTPRQNAGECSPSYLNCIWERTYFRRFTSSGFPSSPLRLGGLCVRPCSARIHNPRLAIRYPLSFLPPRLVPPLHPPHEPTVRVQHGHLPEPVEHQSLAGHVQPQSPGVQRVPPVRE